ncbi:hypothetical protein L1049_008855 [Liquidambar formosana]|uniref:Uncharacterized protein n=1 Tax=Liquidambar formosana TaxID=63359 RepID=A0AAP0X4V7_LIQFO
MGKVLEVIFTLLHLKCLNGWSNNSISMLLGDPFLKAKSLPDSYYEDPHNVRLGLASDEFNPFGNLSISHST